MTAVKTHRKIDKTLSGSPVIIDKGYAVVKLKTVPQMVADEKGLVHGGFIFSAADYSAMLAVNHPNVVLARAEVNFIKPVSVGDEVEFTAQVEKKEGKKNYVKVLGKKNNEIVFEGEFLCIVPDKHVLEKT